MTQPLTRDKRDVLACIGQLAEPVRLMRLLTRQLARGEAIADDAFRARMAFDGWNAASVRDAIDVMIPESLWQADGLRTAKLAPEAEEWRQMSLRHWATLTIAFTALQKIFTATPYSEEYARLRDELHTTNWDDVRSALKRLTQRLKERPYDG